MLMDIAAYVCIAIVLGVMIAMKVHFSHTGTPSAGHSDTPQSIRRNRNSGSKTSYVKGGPKQ